jgi:hypothetical protein
MAGRVRGSAQEGRGRVVNSPERVLSPKRRRRLDPEDREREIVDGAVAFFAEVGFEGGLRDLAKRLEGLVAWAAPGGPDGCIHPNLVVLPLQITSWSS